MATTLLRRGAATALAALAIALVMLAGQALAADALPDLDQEVPAQLDVRVGGTAAQPSYRLGFGSGVRNVGAGPLLIEGRRVAGSGGRMVARQLVEQDGGGAPRALDGVGSLRYVRSVDHQHWHLLGFDRYELRAVGGGRVVRDRKSGFCLGDRYRVTTRAVAGAPAAPVHTGRCGLRMPGLTRVTEGISVGYGDFYAAHLEYQDLPIDGLADGRYLLVHRVNAGRELRESDYGNDAASVLLELAHGRDGVPVVKVLASCPDSARCAAPGAGGPAAAAVPLVRAARRGPASLLCSLSAVAGGWRP